MSARNVLLKPLAITHANACGSSGLSGRSLGAAMWSRTTRFTLVSAHDFAVDDVVRMAQCPLFDSLTPQASRIEGLLACALEGLTNDVVSKALSVHWLSGAKLAQGLPLGRGISGQEVMAHVGMQGFVEALGQTSCVLQKRAQESIAGAPEHILVAAVDSLFDSALLKSLHSEGKLSTESHAQGIIPSEAAAVFAVAHLEHQRRVAPWQQDSKGTLHGACTVPFADLPSQALKEAISGAMQHSTLPQQVDTIIWDIDPDPGYLTALADAVATLTPILGKAQLVRPLQYIGCTGAAFGPVAVVLALEGCRAGLTSGGRTLICSLHNQQACAIWLEAPCYPNIVFADAPAPRDREMP